MRTSIALSWAAAFLCAAGPTAGQIRSTSAGRSVASCEGKQTMVAVGQALAVNLAANRFNVWVSDHDWARVGFQSWSRNLELGWQWDETQFGINMLLHPYHGSLYHEAGRANCLSFWESVPISFLGSWTWEFFAETFRPSLNDFWMTSFGGVALGEVFYRVSVAILDEEAQGGERIAREIAATLVNPVGGLNRLARGQWTGRGVNPIDRLPSEYSFRVSAGARRVEESGAPPGPTSSPTLLVDVAYGDVFDTEHRAPFDVINMLAQVSPDGGGLNILRAVGRLYGKDITSPGSRHRHQILINQRFDYIHNGVYRFGEQSFELGLQSRWRTGPAGLRVSTRLAGDVVMLGAIDALDAASVGVRDIDYGPGLGAIAEITLERDGTRYVSFYNRVRYLHSVSGAPADHTLLFSGIDLTIPITSELGLGAYISGDRRRSVYADFPADERTYVETRVYLTWTLARSRPGAR